jgi:predicted DNA-binding transcriptional regulator YafY
MSEPMETALLKIRSVLPLDRRDDLDRLAKATAIYTEARSAAGLDQRTLLPIQQAIVSRRVLRMNYHGRARNDLTVRDVEPLGLTFHSAAWYLVGWCRLRKDYRYFKLERLQSLEVLTERFEARPDFSLRKHLEEHADTRDTLAVKLWFSGRALERAKRETQAGVTNEKPVRDGFEVDMQTFSLEWVARWLLSFGPEAEALEPARLRKLVRAEAEAVAKRYT